MIMPRDSFIAQMEHLKNNNYNVITLADLEGFLKASRPIPPRSVVITVDDGFRSAYDIAYPILKSYGFRATFFIYTDFLGGGRSLTWAAINEMRASGMIDIQSHSKSHASFSPADGETESNAAYAARIRTEIAPPKAALERQLGSPVNHLAYPYGDTSRLAVQLLGEDKFTLAVTVERGANASFSHPLLLRRDMVFGNATMADFQRYLRVYTRANLK
jgi:peptidoglycan/xylan/chitin deacetylase (PgdA/CDA1 family)